MDLSVISPIRLRLLGGAVDLLTPDEVLRFTARRVSQGRKAVVANHNAHSLALVRKCERMAQFYATADLVEIDSVPLIAWGKLMGVPIGRRHRSTYLDWSEAFWALAAEQGWRVFHLGGRPGVGELAATAIRSRWPSLNLAVHHGYFDRRSGSAENTQILNMINAFDADVVLVGMGMPIQETWILENRDRLNKGVIFPLGGAFDFEAGVQVTPPRWLGWLGFEWLFRFATQPRRLFARYFIEPWSLMGPAMSDVLTALRRRKPANRQLGVELNPFCGD